jgi:hypothetical protein
VAGVGLLALSAVPVVLSLNRGVWLGLGLTLAFAVFWLIRNGNVLALVAVGLGVVVAAVLLLSTPLTSVVQSRFDNPHSDSIRGFTISRTLEVVQESPVLGFGATRRTLGSADSIAVGRGSDCARCGNPVLGSTGQLWLVLIAQGFVGAALYVGFFLRAAWAFRHDRSPLAWAAMLSILLPLFYMLLYNALVVPMLITFMSIALLWRNDQHRRAVNEAATPAVLGPAPLGGAA